MKLIKGIVKYVLPIIMEEIDKFKNEANIASLKKQEIEILYPSIINGKGFISLLLTLVVNKAEDKIKQKIQHNYNNIGMDYDGEVKQLGDTVRMVGVFEKSRLLNLDKQAVIIKNNKYFNITDWVVVLNNQKIKDIANEIAQDISDYFIEKLEINIKKPKIFCVKILNPKFKGNKFYFNIIYGFK